eukprot:303686-Amphidinium_carterae.1
MKEHVQEVSVHSAANSRSTLNKGVPVYIEDECRYIETLQTGPSTYKSALIGPASHLWVSGSHDCNKARDQIATPAETGWAPMTIQAFPSEHTLVFLVSVKQMSSAGRVVIECKQPMSCSPARVFTFHEMTVGWSRLREAPV